MKEIKGNPRIMRMLGIEDVLEEAKKPAPPLTKEQQEEQARLIKELSGMGGFMAVSIPVPTQSGDGESDGE